MEDSLMLIENIIRTQIENHESFHKVVIRYATRSTLIFYQKLNRDEKGNELLFRSSEWFSQCISRPFLLFANAYHISKLAGEVPIPEIEDEIENLQDEHSNRIEGIWSSLDELSKLKLYHAAKSIVEGFGNDFDGPQSDSYQKVLEGIVLEGIGTIIRLIIYN